MLKKSKLLFALLFMSCFAHAQVKDSLFTFENDYVRLSIYGSYYIDSNQSQTKLELLQPNMDSSKDYLLRINEDNSIDFQYNHSKKLVRYFQKVVYKNSSLSYIVNGEVLESINEPFIDTIGLKTIEVNNDTILKINYYRNRAVAKIYHKGILITETLDSLWNIWNRLQICDRYFIPKDFTIELQSQVFGQSPQTPKVDKFNLVGQSIYDYKNGSNTVITENNIADTITFSNVSQTFLYMYLYNQHSIYYPLWINNNIPNIIKSESCFKNEPIELKISTGKSGDWYKNYSLISTNKTNIVVNEPGRYEYKLADIDQFGCSVNSVVEYLKKCEILQNVFIMKVYEDLNRNMILDPNETMVSNAQILYNGKLYTTDQNGQKLIILEDTSYFKKLEVSKIDYYKTTVHRSYDSYSISVMDELRGFYDTVVFVPLYKIPQQNGYLSAENNRFRPGFNAMILPVVSNKSNNKLTGFIEVFGNYPLMPSTVDESLVDSTKKVYCIYPITVESGASMALGIQPLKISRFATPNSQGCYKVVLKGWTDNGEFIRDSIFVCQNITASCDPNDISVAPQGPYLNQSTLPNTDLDYTIRFQNTGNDTAFTVVVIDTLDAHIEPSSLTMISASHKYTLDIKNHVATWTFPNILLPDSNVNSPGSNGNFIYRIKQKKDVPFNTFINNRVGIYFDFNEVVLTNTVSVKIADLNARVTTIAEEIDTETSIYPNPANDQVTVNIKGEAVFIIYDIQGKVIFQKQVEGQSPTDVSRIEPGIYFCKVNNKRIQKLIIY